MVGLKVEALSLMLGSINDLEESDRVLSCEEPLFEPVGQQQPSTSGSTLAGAAATATPPQLHRSASLQIGSEDALEVALVHAPVRGRDQGPISKSCRAACDSSEKR